MAKALKTIASKTAAGKKDTGKSEIGIKYSDKSAGQPEMVTIFNEIKKLLLPYEKGAIKVLGGKEGQVLLISKKEITVSGKKLSELWFASALVQKGYVGFYFMPIYGQPKLGAQLHPDLMKCLKGKSCFHIEKNDKEMYKHIQDALKVGYASYKEMGWV
jgi:hypothetical protein